MEKLTSGYRLIEGPVWCASRGLIFSDVQGGGVFCIDSSGRVETIIEHRRGIGGMVLHADGGLVVGGRNIAHKRLEDGATTVLLDRDEANGNVGYNDITTDEHGRIYAGSLGSAVFNDEEQVPGALHVIDLDGSTRVVAEDIVLTNGLGFSPDGRTLYHSDSRRETVFCYAASANGDLGAKQPFVQTRSGAPDGLAVSEDGAVWVALAGGGCVAVYEPDGSERERIDIPLPMATSVCFGGGDLRDLYIVSGSQGAGGSLGADSEQAGSVFKTRVAVAGLPVAPARVPVG